MRLPWNTRGHGVAVIASTHCSPESEHLIDLQHVVKTYESAAGTFTALKGVDLQIRAGEFVGVVGKSGCGKSTLINMVAGIDRPTAGGVHIGGIPIHTLTESQLAAWRGRNLGIVFQFFQLLPSLSVIENVMLPMDFCATYPPRERPQRAMALLEQMEMAEHAYKPPSALSGGQQQRVAIARALANDPSVLVADEPTGNLDSRTADAVFRLFRRLAEAGKTILMVTHDRDLTQRVDRAVIIADGQIVEEISNRSSPSSESPASQPRQTESGAPRDQVPLAGHRQRSSPAVTGA